MKRILSLVLGLMLLAGECLAVEIIAPTDSIEPGEYERIRVTDIKPEQYRGMVLDWSPKEVLDTNGKPVLDKDGKPISTRVTVNISRDVFSDDLFLDFRARVPGKYRLTLSQNKYQRTGQEYLELVTQAKIDAVLLAKLTTDIAAIKAKYPYVETGADITVAGEQPKPPPDPIPVDGIAEQLVVLRNQRLTTTAKVAVLLDLQERYQKGTKPEMYIIDSIDPSTVAKSWMAIKPASAGFPYYFLTAKGGKILAQGEVAETLEKNNAIIEKFQEKK